MLFSIYLEQLEEKFPEIGGRSFPTLPLARYTIGTNFGGSRLLSLAQLQRSLVTSETLAVISKLVLEQRAFINMKNKKLSCSRHN